MSCRFCQKRHSSDLQVEVVDCHFIIMLYMVFDPTCMHVRSCLSLCISHIMYQRKMYVMCKWDINFWLKLPGREALYVSQGHINECVSVILNWIKIYIKIKKKQFVWWYFDVLMLIENSRPTVSINVWIWFVDVTCPSIENTKIQIICVRSMILC